MAIFCKKVKNFLKNLKTHSAGGKNPLLECVFCVRMMLHLFIIGCGIVDQLALFGETRAVAGAIPRMLGAVVFEGASEVWTSGRGGR